MLISKFDSINIVEDIRIFEKKYDLKIPDQYKKFLEKYNGGKTPNTNFKINRISSDISGFYGFGEVEKFYNYKSIEEKISFKEWVGDDMLPIGKNTFGDYIMLGIGKENNGEIYFYYHDRDKKYIKLVDDIKTFVSICKSKRVGHIRTIQERRNDMIKLGKGDRITPQKLAGWQAEIDEFVNIHQEELLLV